MVELTVREFLIAEMISKGMTNKQIADKLNLQTKTVERHVSSIYSKVVHNGDHSRVTVARYIWNMANENKRGTIRLCAWCLMDGIATCAGVVDGIDRMVIADGMCEQCCTQRIIIPNDQTSVQGATHTRGYKNAWASS